jgi:hypothetical protein
VKEQSIELLDSGKAIGILAVEELDDARNRCKGT